MQTWLDARVTQSFSLLKARKSPVRSNRQRVKVSTSFF